MKRGRVSEEFALNGVKKNETCTGTLEREYGGYQSVGRYRITPLQKERAVLVYTAQLYLSARCAEEIIVMGKHSVGEQGVIAASRV